jgi:hypothetical protein
MNESNKSLVTTVERISYIDLDIPFEADLSEKENYMAKVYELTKEKRDNNLEKILQRGCMYLNQRKDENSDTKP